MLFGIVVFTTIVRFKQIGGFRNSGKEIPSATDFVKVCNFLL